MPGKYRDTNPLHGIYQDVPIKVLAFQFLLEVAKQLPRRISFVFRRNSFHISGLSPATWMLFAAFLDDSLHVSSGLMMLLSQIQSDGRSWTDVLPYGFCRNFLTNISCSRCQMSGFSHKAGSPQI